MRTKGNWDFEQIFDRYFERVYGYVAYRVAGNRELAKDITQEVFLAALKALPNFRGDGSLLSWLRSIARKKVTDHFRAREGLPEHTLDDHSLDIDLHLSEKQDRAVLVSEVMRELPSNYGEFLEEKYLEGLSVKEIARQRKMSEKAVESALSRARDAFRKTYEKLQSRKETSK